MQPTIPTHKELAIHYTTAVDALREIALAHFTCGRLSDARRLLRTSLQLLEVPEAEPQYRLKLLLQYAKVLIIDFFLTRTDADLLFSATEQAKQLAEVIQDRQSIADALSLLGQVHYMVVVLSGVLIDSPQGGKYTEALAYQEQALALWETLHNTRGISESHFWIGVIYERWQQFDQAQEHYMQARRVAEQYGHLFIQAELARHRAVPAFFKGDLDQSLTEALQALSFREAAPFKPFLPLDHLLLRDIYQAKGDTANAESHTMLASALAEEIGYPTYVSLAPSFVDIRAKQPDMFNGA